MLETFLLRLSLGFTVGLWVLPAGLVASRFYRIHLLIVLSFMVGVGATVGEAGEVFWIALGLAVAACLAGVWNWGTEGRTAGYAALLLCTVSLAVAVLSLPEGGAYGGFAPAAAPRALASAALLGMTTTAMLMGHWYLIAPTMSLAPLVRLVQATFVALGLRTAVAATELGLWLALGQPLDRLAWAWLAVRWGAGILALAVVVALAWQTTKIRSTQSATGILYVAVILCFLGELTDQLLQEHVHALARGSA